MSSHAPFGSTADEDARCALWAQRSDHPRTSTKQYCRADEPHLDLVLCGGTAFEYSPDARTALRRATQVLWNAGAHFTNEATLFNASQALFDTLGSRPRCLGVAEYAPAHFPGSPHGEYQRNHQGVVSGHMPGLPTCTPHAAVMQALANWRRTVGLDFAARHALQVMPLWDQSAPNFDDHPPLSSCVGCGKPGSMDCRHWCNPGKTLNGWVKSFIDFLTNCRPIVRQQGRRDSASHRIS